MIKIGQKVQIRPFDHMRSSGMLSLMQKKATGTVVYVNQEHRWFTVEYGDPVARISYNFADIGTEVQLIK